MLESISLMKIFLIILISFTSMACLQGGILVPNQSSTNLIGSASYQALVGFNPIASSGLTSASYAAVVSSSSVSASQTGASTNFQFSDPFIDAVLRGLEQ